MADDDGRVWGRPEAVDTLGRLPGRFRRSLGTLVGLVAVGTGGFVAYAEPAPARPADRVEAGPVSGGTCVAVGMNVPPDRMPAEGVAASTVVRLSRADEDGRTQLLVPATFVVQTAPTQDGGAQLSVLVRVDAAGAPTDLVEQINGANADRSLSVAVLYDIDPLRVLNECRS